MCLYQVVKNGWAEGYVEGGLGTSRLIGKRVVADQPCLPWTQEVGVVSKPWVLKGSSRSDSLWGMSLALRLSGPPTKSRMGGFGALRSWG